MIKVTASFDDGSIYDLRTADVMYSFKIPTTFYIPVNWRKYLIQKGIEPLKEEHVKQIAKEFEIGSHTVNHQLLTRIDAEEQIVEIYESKAFWDKYLNQDTKKFCYPRGYFTSDISQIVSASGYEEARTTLIGELNPPKDPFVRNTTIHVGCDRKEYGSSWLEFGRRMISQALEKEALGEEVDFHFWGHSEEIHRNQEWDNFIRFMELLNENILS